MFYECGGIDAFIDAKRKRFIEELKASMKAKRLFFGQEVTPDIICYVEADPEISFGRREEESVFVTKIPFQLKKWLEEKDPKIRRYLYCHCPWARESILSREGSVPAEFCRCSAGTHKRVWEAIFEKPLECEVMESVLAGDDRCRFKIMLPPNSVL